MPMQKVSGATFAGSHFRHQRDDAQDIRMSNSKMKEKKNTVGTFLMLKLALKEINHWPLAPFIFSPYFDYNQSPDVVCP